MLVSTSYGMHQILAIMAVIADLQAKVYDHWVVPASCQKFVYPSTVTYFDLLASCVPGGRCLLVDQLSMHSTHN